MEQSNLLELAKQGEPNAIAALMNAVLQPKGITTRARLENDCLCIFLESTKALNQDTLVAFIRKGLLELGIRSIHRVKVQGKKVGDGPFSWTREFSVIPLSQSSVPASKGEAVKTETIEPKIAPILDHEKIGREAVPELVRESVSVLEREPETEEVEQEDVDDELDPAPSFPELIKIYWKAYRFPIMLVAVGMFVAGAIVATFSTPYARKQSKVENVLQTSTQSRVSKQQEAEKYLKAMNKAQEDFYKKNSRFAATLEELERSANLIAQSYSYSYRLKVSDHSVITAVPREANLKSYIGAVFVGQSKTLSTICRTIKPSMEAPPKPELAANQLKVECPARSSKI